MTPAAQAFKAWWAVRPAACRVAEVLYEAGGALVSTADLREITGQTLNGLHFSLKQLRAAMDSGSIANVLGQGFFMTPVGLAECERALLDAAEREHAA